MEFITTSSVPTKIPNTEITLKTYGTPIVFAVSCINSDPFDLVMDDAVIVRFNPYRGGGNYEDPIYINCPAGQHHFHLQTQSDDGQPKQVNILRLWAREIGS